MTPRQLEYDFFDSLRFGCKSDVVRVYYLGSLKPSFERRAVAQNLCRATSAMILRHRTSGGRRFDQTGCVLLVASEFVVASRARGDDRKVFGIRQIKED